MRRNHEVRRSRSHQGEGRSRRLGMRQLSKGEVRPQGGAGRRQRRAGGSILIRANHHLNTLLDYRYKNHYSAARGDHGLGLQKIGEERRGHRTRGADGNHRPRRPDGGCEIRPCEGRRGERAGTREGAGAAATQSLPHRPTRPRAISRSVRQGRKQSWSLS